MHSLFDYTDTIPKEKNPEEIKKTVNRLLKKEEKKRKKLKELGIDYDFGGYVSNTL